VGLLRRRERAWLVLLVMTRVLARCALVAVAVGVARGGPAPILLSTLGLALLLALQGGLHQATVRAARGALARRVVDRLLGTDVLRGAPATHHETLTSTLDSLYLAQQVVAEHVPGFVGDSVAAAVIGIAAAAVLSAAPYPALPVVLGAVVLGSLVLGVAFAATNRAASTAARAFEPVYDDIATAAGGRLELVASGLDDEHRAALAEHLARWRRLATRSDALLAVAGRAPVAAASLAIGAAVYLNGSLRGALGDLPLVDAAIAASAIPCFVGAVRNLVVLARDAVRVEPLVALLAAADAPHGGPPGTPLPPPPRRVQWTAISFSYGDDASRGGFALRDVSVAWEPGQILVLAGPNGSGKSTLFRLLLGLARPTAGEVRVGGVDLFSLDLRAWRRCVAYLPQRPYLGEDSATVRESMALLARSATEAEMRAALERVALFEALERAAPGDPLGASVRALSAGQKQRLALARVLCQRAPVVVLDEPDANLDRAGIETVGAIVRELRGKCMVALAAHTPELVEVGDVRVTLADGRVARTPGA
jgi:ATP-binding cassette subfamily C protein CydCD